MGKDQRHAHYELTPVPVLDPGKRLIGRITFDQVMGIERTDGGESGNKAKHSLSILDAIVTIGLAGAGTFVTIILLASHIA